MTSPVRRCREHERADILEIACARGRSPLGINAAALAYWGVIPADRWREPYMDATELDGEIAAGVESGVASRPAGCPA